MCVDWRQVSLSFCVFVCASLSVCMVSMCVCIVCVCVCMVCGRMCLCVNMMPRLEEDLGCTAFSTSLHHIPLRQGLFEYWLASKPQQSILFLFPASHAGVTGTYRTTPGTYSQHTTGAEAELRSSCLHNKHAHPPSHLPIQYSFILWRMLSSLGNSICGDSWAEIIRAMISVRGRVLVLDLVTTAYLFYRGEQHFGTSFLSAKKIHA